MNSLKKLSVVFMLVSAIFMTGCDASKIMDVISGVAKGITDAMPKIKEVVDVFKGIFSNDNNNAAAPTASTTATVNASPTVDVTASDTTSTTASGTPATDNNDAEIKVTPATDEEEVKAPAEG